VERLVGGLQPGGLLHYDDRVVDASAFEVDGGQVVAGLELGVTREVDAKTGWISTADGQEGGGAPGTRELAITHLPESLLLVHGPQPKVPTALQTDTSDELFAVSYPENGVLRTDFWRISDDGTASAIGGGASGQDVRGEVAIQTAVDETSLARFTGSGFLTASLLGDDQSLEVWELRDSNSFFLSGADVVGLDGWKGGRQPLTVHGYDPETNQLACDAFEQANPMVGCIWCNIGKATRLGRPFVAEVQQSQALSDRDLAVKDLLY